MKRSQRRLLTLLVAVPMLVVGCALFYMMGMALLEGSPRGFWRSLEWSAETLSTTGYGADARWSHPLMVIFVVLVQFIGVFLVFLIIPIYLVPFLEERFEERLPRQADAKLQDHVIVCKYGPAVETLIERLRPSRTVPLVIERDEATARTLVEHGTNVVFAREDDDALNLCNLDRARALVANGRDEENGALILRARQLGFRGDIYALVEEPAHRRPMELAGATAAYTPRHILAAALAARASDKIAPPIYGIEQMRGIELRQYRVKRNGPLAGRRAAETKQLAAPLTLAGIWSGGTLQTAALEHATLPADAILLLLGNADAFEALRPEEGFVSLRSEGTFLVAGFGEVGAKVHQLLTDAGEVVRSIDRRASELIDVTGNVLDPEVLRRGGIEATRAVILALDSDDATMFATVIAREVAPDVPIIARVNHARNVANIYAAGADFALSISEVSGQMLSHRLLRDSSTASTSSHLQIARVERDLRSETIDCSIVAVEQNGELLGPNAPGTVDAAWICGTTEALRKVR
jgi:Trk K+ transport system NAD-binding subunit